MRDIPGLSTDARFIRYRSFRRDTRRGEVQRAVCGVRKDTLTHGTVSTEL